MNLESILKDFGLTKRQAGLYLNCLELGSASAYKIAKKASLPRSTCYEELDDLKELGLVSTFRKKKVKYYSAEDPQKFIRTRKEKIEMFEEMLPQFNALYMSQKNKPQVRFYEGREGMKTVFNEMLTDQPREILGFSAVDDLFANLATFFPGFLKKRIKKKIAMKIIMRDTPLARERQQLGQSELRQVRLIPTAYQHHGITAIWKNKIAMFSFEKEMMALLIKSPTLAQTQKVMWQVIWDSLDNKIIDNKKQTTKLA